MKIENKINIIYSRIPVQLRNEFENELHLQLIIAL